MLLSIYKIHSRIVGKEVPFISAIPPLPRPVAFLHPLCFKPPAVSTVGSSRDISKPSREGRVQRQNF